MPEAVTVDRVRKVYASGLEAIREVSFGVGAGEFVSVLGPSGCGKSTLLMMVAGLLAPTGGEIRVDGTPVRGPRREIGVVFQSPVLCPGGPCSRTCCYPSRCSGCPAGSTS